MSASQSGALLTCAAPWHYFQDTSFCLLQRVRQRAAAAANLRIRDKESAKRVRAVLDRLDCSIVKKPTHRTISGEQQRLCIGRAIVQRLHPQADEPTGISMRICRRNDDYFRIHSISRRHVADCDPMDAACCAISQVRVI